MVLSIKMDDIYSRLPLIYVFMSGLGFSIQTLIVKLLSERGFKGSFACVLARGVFQLVMSSMFIYFDSERQKPTLSNEFSVSFDSETHKPTFSIECF